MDNSLYCLWIGPQATEPQINDWLEPHYVINPSSVAVNRLFLFLPGSFGNPNRQTLITQQAAKLGYHAINLNYPNSWTVGSLCKTSRDPNCTGNVRQEIIQGQDTSPEIEVNRANSIENRLVKLLQYLSQTYPEQGWSQYLDGDLVRWNLLVVAGHSQGGGHAAMIGKLHQVERVVMFGAPADISRRLRALAPWLSEPGATASERYFGFAHAQDPGIKRIVKAWEALGLTSYGAMVNVDVEHASTFTPNSHQFITSAAPALPQKYHGSVVTDSTTPRSSDGTPMFKEIWQTLLAPTL